MKQINLAFLIIMLVSSTKLLSQVAVPDKPFVKLKTGQIITGNSITFDEKIFGADKITLDGTTYKSIELDFFGNGQSIYGRMTNEFTPHFHQKNNLYFFKTYRTHVSGSGSSATYTQHVYYSYSNGIDQTKAIRATNLLNDIKDNEEVINMLKKAIRHRNASRIFLGVTVVSGAILLASVQNGEKKPIIGPISLGIGVISFITSLSQSHKKNKFTRRAIENYAGIKF